MVAGNIADDGSGGSGGGDGAAAAALTAAATATKVPTRYDVYVLLVLMMCNVLNQGHRQLLAVLLPAGMRCLPGANGTDGPNLHGDDDCIAITVAQQGALMGPAFAIPFVLGGVPLARCADTFRRTTVLSVSLACWSTAVMCQAFTTDASLVLVLRMALGCFEAGCNPCAYAILMSYWGGTSKSGLAFGTYALGVYVGFGAAYMSAASSSETHWRSIWLVAGLVGYAVSALTLTIKEPVRAGCGKKGPAAPASSAPALAPAPPAFFLRTLLRSKKYRLIVGASACTMTARFALLGWLATFYQSHHGIAPAEFGPVVGVIIVVAGGISAFSGGTISDRFPDPASRVNICTLSQLVPMPFWVGVLLVPDPTASFALFFVAMLTGDMYLGVAAATLQRIVPTEMAARGNQIFLAVSTLVGSCGPLMVGVLFDGGAQLPKILAAWCSLFFALSGLCFHLLKLEMSAGDAAKPGEGHSFDNPAFGLQQPRGEQPPAGGEHGEHAAVGYGYESGEPTDGEIWAHAAINDAYG